MKKLFFVLFALSTTLASANPSFTYPVDYEMVSRISDSSYKERFLYLRLLASEGSGTDFFRPGLGLGYRQFLDVGAIDISLNVQNSWSGFFWSVPKGSYLYYFKPSEEQRTYLGAGLSIGGIKGFKDNFVGIIPHLVCGYEFSHKGSVLGFAEVSLNQPPLPVYIKGNLSGPVVEVSLGAGF